MKVFNKTLKIVRRYLVIFLFLNLFIFVNAQQIGDQGMTFDNSKFDNAYPFMREWQKAGVEGGIPYRSNVSVQRQISPTNSDGIQRAIDALNTSGNPSVIFLKNGTYTIDKPIKMKSNVILRGENKNEVLLRVVLRSDGNRSRTALEFRNVSRSALEDLSFEYIPPKSITLYDDRNVPLNQFCGDRCFGNNPAGERNMYVSFLKMDRGTKNCWVDNCNFKNSGTDPFEISANHNTFRKNFIDACFNKGGGGNGYYDIKGDYNLIVNEKVRRIRHFAIQNGAKYNVVIACDFEVDVNFHNGDDGFNLIEGNTIKSERWRSWGAFASGGARFGHDKPGNNNIVFNNVTSGRGSSADFSSSSKVFVFDQYKEPRLLNNNPPRGNTFYPFVLNAENSTPPPTPDDNQDSDSNNITDLARGKSTFQSSTYASSTGAEKVVDGNESTFNHTQKENNPWWEVDLGSIKNIKEVKIWNRGDCCQNRLQNFDIRIYETRGGSQVKSVFVSGQPSANGSTYQINASGRVVRIQLRGNNRFLHMDQVSVIEGNSSNNATTGDIPYGKIISLKKSGGDKRYVTVENNNELVANRTRVGVWEQFRVDRHPNGGVALFSLKNNKYVQSNGANTNSAIRAQGISSRGWERFRWENKGEGKVAFYSYTVKKWLRAAWNIDNTKIFPKGSEDRGWETFEWSIVANKQIEKIIQKSTLKIYPNPSLNEWVTISGLQGSLVTIVDVVGKIIYVKSTDQLQVLLDISSFQSGVYFVRNGTNTEKLIVK